jgi:hypothetical protein
MDRDASYPNPCITDVPTTVFTTTAEGRTTVVSADALGVGPSGCPGVDDGARAKLEAFRSKLTDLGSWLPEDRLGPEEPYVAAEIRIYVRPYRAEPGLAQEPIAWPLEPIAWPLEPLAGFGEPFDGMRCGVVRGAELEALRPLLERANQPTPWESAGGRYGLLLRPLLPDEHGC